MRIYTLNVRLNTHTVGRSAWIRFLGDGPTEALTHGLVGD